MTGYIFIAFLVAAVGIYFYLINLYGGYPYFGTTLNSTLYIFMVAIPVLTMRSFAEEKRSKTDQLLLTSPVSATGIVMGKYLAMLYVYVFPVLLSAILSSIDRPHRNSVLCSGLRDDIYFLFNGCALYFDWHVYFVTVRQSDDCICEYVCRTVGIIPMGYNRLVYTCFIGGLFYWDINYFASNRIFRISDEQKLGGVVHYGLCAYANSFRCICNR